MRADQNCFSIQPRHNANKTSPLGLLDQARFSARLATSNETTNRLLSLPDPTYSANGHTYVLCPDTHSLPSDTYDLEVTLEFGHYAFESSGRLCPGVGCSFEEVDIIGSQVHYSGQLINGEDGTSLPIVDVMGQPEKPSSFCQLDDSLTGYWEAEQYFGTECQLLSTDPELLFTILTEQLQPDTNTWLHFIGDSIVRETLIQAADLVPFPIIFYNDIPEDWGPTNLMGVVTLDGNRTLIMTYRTWFRSDMHEPYQDAGTLELLQSVLDVSSFGGVFDVAQIPTTMRHLVPVGPPTRTFLSMGAHSAYFTETGLEDSWKITTPTLLAANEISPLTLLLHTYAQADLIPTKFGPQGVIRNNVAIQWLNRWIGLKAEEVGFSTLDWTSVSSAGIGRNQIDAVHAKPFVYYAQFMVALTAVLVNR